MSISSGFRKLSLALNVMFRLFVLLSTYLLRYITATRSSQYSFSTPEKQVLKYRRHGHTFPIIT